LPILFVSALPPTFNDFGVRLGLIRLSIFIATTALTFWVARTLIKNYPANRLNIYFSALFIASALSPVLAFFIFQDEVTTHFINTFIITAIWLTLLTITCGLIVAALSQRQEIIQDLESQIDRVRVRTISENNETIRLSNDMAKYLHGNLQSRLMASALAIEAAGKAEDAAGLVAEIEKARQSISTPFDQFASHELGPLTHELRHLQKMWDGVLITDLVFVGSEETISAIDTRNIIHVIEESFSNALRHGLATEVKIIVISTEAGISVSAIDNGLGPRAGTPGLGSSLFNSIAGSNWSLSRGPDGVGSQLNLQITK
jgi:signal transduction histidine kinase